MVAHVRTCRGEGGRAFAPGTRRGWVAVAGRPHQLRLPSCRSRGGARRLRCLATRIRVRGHPSHARTGCGRSAAPRRAERARAARAAQPRSSRRLTGRPASCRGSFQDPNRAVIAFALGQPRAPEICLYSWWVNSAPSSRPASFSALIICSSVAITRCSQLQPSRRQAAAQLPSFRRTIGPVGVSGPQSL